MESCWLCYDSAPPFYEGIAVTEEIFYSSDHSKCRWSQQAEARLTMTSVSGLGLCIGNSILQKHRHLCNVTITQPSHLPNYILPGDNSWWTCSDGLIPCIHTPPLKSNLTTFCILVQLMPCLTYYSGEDCARFGDAINDHALLRTKRKAITAVKLTVLRGPGAVGAGMGITSLILSNKHYSDLHQTINKDVERLEIGITNLEKSLISLSEVVLQNRMLPLRKSAAFTQIILEL